MTIAEAAFLLILVCLGGAGVCLLIVAIVGLFQWIMGE